MVREVGSGFAGSAAVCGRVALTCACFVAACAPATEAVAPPTVTVASALPEPAPVTCPSGMVAVSGGRFEMVAYPSGRVPVVVEPFCLDATEATVEAFAGCVGAGRCNADLHKPSPAHDRLCNFLAKDRQRHPMNCVDFYQAEAFCRARGARLPTGAEWQWVFRAGDMGAPFPWGNAPAADQLCWSGVASRRQALSGTCEVASFANDSKLGVHDLAGNVEEWLSDEDERHRRWILGGSWATDDAVFLGLAIIGPQPPELQDNTVGFRCAHDR